MSVCPRRFESNMELVEKYTHRFMKILHPERYPEPGVLTTGEPVLAPWDVDDYYEIEAVRQILDEFYKEVAEKGKTDG